MRKFNQIYIKFILDLKIFHISDVSMFQMNQVFPDKSSAT